MFDKHRRQTQSSAFKRQRKPFPHHAHLFRPTPPALRSLSPWTGSIRTSHRSVYLKRLADLLEVL